MYAQAYFDSALKPRFLTLTSSMEMETGWGNSMGIIERKVCIDDLAS